MLRIIVIFIVLLNCLEALEVPIYSDNFSKISEKLSDEKNIAKLLAEPRVQYASLQRNIISNISINKGLTKVQSEYARLKMLLVYLPKQTKKIKIKEKLKESFFRAASDLKKEFSFVYKISYPNSGGFKGDVIFDNLQKEISLYILAEYGLSNIKDIIKMTNTEFSNITESYTIGTTESNFEKNVDNPYYYENGRTFRSGIISFIFYPFVLVKQNHKISVKDKLSFNENKIKKNFYLIQEGNRMKNLPFSFSESEKEMIQKFLNTYMKEYNDNSARRLNQISSKIQKYSSVAELLFNKNPKCKTLACLDTTLQMKLASFKTLNKQKRYEYDIDLSNDDDLEYVVLPAFRKLQKFLRRDTQFNSFEDTQTLDNNSYSQETKESKFIAIVQSISMIPYMKEHRIGIHFSVGVSFEESDLCAQYYMGNSAEKLYGLRFVRLNPFGKTIEVSQTEVTNTVFNKIYPRALKESSCQVTRKSQQPVNCLSYETLDKFLVKLNKKSRKYQYRFLTCKEAFFLATCGNNQKYCWGNKLNFQKDEFLRNDKYDLNLKINSSKRKSYLGLYDFCGNALEYCTDKRGWYRGFGSTKRNLEPKVYRNSYSDISSIRLVREKR